MFKGEYLNGKKENIIEQYIPPKNGYQKIYDENNNLLFEGNFVDGKKCGKGKEYDKKGRILFEGEYLYDFRLKGKK